MGRLINFSLLLLSSCSTPVQEFHLIQFDEVNGFRIAYEDSVYNVLEGLSEIEENVKITADTRLITDSQFPQMDEIKFTEARLNQDTLNVLIYETNTIFDYKYKIKIIKDKFRIDFGYKTTIDTTERQIKTVKQTLILNKKEFKKGQEIRGHTEYEGQCVIGCAADEKPIVIKGNFKVMVE
jgi:hypothetical protein